jgi:outer membrane protein, multidrug efflux system
MNSGPRAKRGRCAQAPRYKEGKASYYEVLEAQQQLYPAENALARLEAARQLAVVKLYKSLGGGWENMEPSARAQAQTTPPAK